MRAPLVATACLVGAGSLWAWVAPGYAYLGAFGLMGAGELGGSVAVAAETWSIMPWPSEITPIWVPSHRHIHGPQ